MPFFDACFKFKFGDDASRTDKNKLDVDPEAIHDSLIVIRERQVAQDEERLRDALAVVDVEKATLAQQLADFQQQQKELEVREEAIKEREQACANTEEALEARTQSLEARTQSLEVQGAALQALENALVQRETTLQSKDVEEREARLSIQEARLEGQLTNIAISKTEIQADLNDIGKGGQTAPSVDDESTEVGLSEQLTISIDEGEEIIISASHQREPRGKDGAEPEESSNSEMPEREKLYRRIDEELDTLIKQAEEEEMEEPFEEEAIEALRIGAKAVAYKKKFYDVMRDEIVYFPSLVKSMLNYTIIEEAEKHYFEEDDEFPLVYAAALRSIAAMKLAAEDENDGNENMDEDYMEKLALDVE